MTYMQPSYSPPFPPLPSTGSDRMAGGPQAFAVVLRLADPASDLLVRRIALLRDCVALAGLRWGLRVEAAAILPAEAHLLCSGVTLADLGPALRLIRSTFARHAIDDPGSETVGAADSLWEATPEVVDVAPAALPSRRAFVLAAPVRAGLVQQPADWPYSSLHRRGAPGPDDTAARRVA